MIIARSPLRISLGGGGTDLPSYYQTHGGFLIAGAINKYVCVTAHNTFLTHLIIRYSKIEHVESRTAIEHPIIREAFRLLGIEERNIEITTMADIPAGTGLGSSGSFGTGLLRVLHRLKNRVIDQRDLAEMACHIEIDLLQEPVGKQDQYAASFGGLNCYEFPPDGPVSVKPLDVTDETLRRFQDSVLIFSTGITRAAPKILKQQHDETRSGQSAMIDNLHFVKELGYKSKAALEAGNLDEFGHLMHVHWQHKKLRSSLISTQEVDRWYESGREAGATGGKLMGAGGGGFLMFHTSDPTRLRRAMEREGLPELKYKFEFHGTKLIQ